jgi:hypothetical protein
VTLSQQGVRCERAGCRHPYVQHAPGGGNCMYWFPLNGEHCDCHGFRWVSLADEPARQLGHASSPRSGEGKSPAG